MKNRQKILILLAVTGIVAALLIIKFYINKPHEDIEKATPAFSIQADQLWKQYNDDLVLSDSLYTGQVIEITGNLSHTETSDSLIYAVFVMEADSMFGSKSIRCEMLPKYRDQTVNLSDGSQVKIKGLCNGYDETDIKFSKCSIIN